MSTINNDKSRDQARMLKRALRKATCKQVGATTLKTKIRVGLQMAEIVDQLDGGWQARALRSAPEETMQELAERQAAALTVKTKIRLGLKLAALARTA